MPEAPDFLPLIAILRGVRPEEVLDICDALIDAGIHRIEVPLNSPSPFESIAKAVKKYGDTVMFGAGTVLSVADVQTLATTGAHMVVSPNCNAAVIRATKAAGLRSYPGILTPTEAFTALEAGADALKIFPANVIGSDGVKAMKAVLPADTKIYVVGGADASTFGTWLNAGADGFGIGSALYKPGFTPDQVHAIATECVAAYAKAAQP